MKFTKRIITGLIAKSALSALLFIGNAHAADFKQLPSLQDAPQDIQMFVKNNMRGGKMVLRGLPRAKNLQGVQNMRVENLKNESLDIAAPPTQLSNYHNTPNNASTLSLYLGEAAWDAIHNTGPYNATHALYSTFETVANSSANPQFDQMFQDFVSFSGNPIAKSYYAPADAFRKNNLFLTRTDMAVTIANKLLTESGTGDMTSLINTFGNLLGNSNLAGDFTTFAPANQVSVPWANYQQGDNTYYECVAFILFLQSFNNPLDLNSISTWLNSRTIWDVYGKINEALYIDSLGATSDNPAGSWNVSEIMPNIAFSIPNIPIPTPKANSPRC